MGNGANDCKFLHTALFKNNIVHDIPKYLQDLLIPLFYEAPEKSIDKNMKSVDKNMKSIDKNMKFGDSFCPDIKQLGLS